MSFDAETYRTQARKSWGAVADSWARHADTMRHDSMPVTTWLLEAARLQPGHQVLDLAAGIGDLGFMAHEMIRPGGRLITSDFAPEMLSAAQERATLLGLEGVRFKQVDAESIDFPAATLDAVLCRWGLMFVADPNAALRECRRVLKPGGRLCFAVWAQRERNPWTGVIADEVETRDLMPRVGEGEPGQFAWSRPGLVQQLLEEAGFVDEIEVESVEWDFTDETFEEWWARTLDMGRIGQALRTLPETGLESVRGTVRERLARYEGDDGLLRLPACTWVAAATA